MSLPPRRVVNGTVPPEGLRGRRWRRRYPGRQWPISAIRVQRLSYTIHGEGPRPTVLLPGLLMSQKMQTPLARTLARRGNRVITLDPLGHGRTVRPPASDVALLDDGVRPPDGGPARPPGTRGGDRRRDVAGRERDARARRGLARAAPRHAPRDARAGPRDPGLRGRLHPAAARPHLRRARDEGRRPCCPTGAA